MKYYIDHYTAAWDAAMCPRQPDIGDTVEIAYEPDGREWDAFLRVLAPNLRLEFIDNDPDRCVDEYEIVERGPGEGPL